jgi:DNA-binding transcriptional ArsR family regulator
MENLKTLYIEGESAIEMAELFQALANSKRLRILHMLGKVEDHFPPEHRIQEWVSQQGMKKALRLSQSTVSEFMAILLRTGFIRSCYKGKFVYYRRDSAAFAGLVARINKEL